MSLNVELGDRAYAIHTGRGLASQIADYLKVLESRGRRALVLVDENVAEAQGSFMEAAFGTTARLVLPAGESTKCFSRLEEVSECLARERVDRGGLLVAFGGGVIGDLGGFAAASYLRGIDYIQVPTTLLAMVDSSVGGKTGINLNAGKNLVGAFWQPQAVFADMALLATLPAREFSAGMAEVIKYGMLADEQLFEELERLPKLDSNSPGLSDIVERCCEIKAQIVKDDEKETAASGGRALLNLGHTFGHAIENVSGYGVYLHGEAIAIGLLLATRLSMTLGHLDAVVLERVRQLLEKYNLPTRLREPLDTRDLIDAMQRDKKMSAGTLRFVAMEQLGEAVTVRGVDAQTVEMLWREAGAI